MIQVKVVELKKRDQFDLGVLVKNSAAKLFADSVRKRIKDLKCGEDHPTRLTVTIKADRNKTMTVHKTDYCCNKFADSVQINIEH